MEKKGTEKIVLPRGLQIQMLEFFLKTSIPRKKEKASQILSNSEKDEVKQ